MFKKIIACSLAGTLLACGGSNNKSADTSSSVSSTTTSASSSAQMLSSSSTSVLSSVISSSTSSSSDLCTGFNKVEGFASLNGGTTGGADKGSGSYVQSVTTGAQLISVLSTTSSYADKPLTVYIDGKITWENSGANSIKIQRKNVSIIGRTNAEIVGIGFAISDGASNIIIRNLLMHEVPQSRGAGDHINIDGQNAAINNIWIDHNEFYNDLTVDKDFYDELVSGRSRVHNVTISYNYFHDSQKTSLWGSSDTASEEDVGRTISFHNNYWKDVNSRLPLFRFGEGHVWNSYYENVTGSGINSRMGAKMRINNNLFENAKNPIWSDASTTIGYWNATGNIFTNPSWGGEFNATCSTPPCYAGGNTQTTNYEPPYQYTLREASTVKSHLQTYAGRNKINACLGLTSTTSSTSSTTTSSTATTSSATGTNSSTALSSVASSSSSIISSSSSSTSSSAPVSSIWACPTSGLYFCDDFSGGNADKWDLLPTGTGNTLTPNGKFDVVADSGNYVLRYTAASTGGVLALIKPASFTGVTSADYYVEAKIRPRVNGTTSNKQIYILGRYQDGNNWYAAALNVQNTNTTTQVELAKMKAGTITRPVQAKKTIDMGASGALDGTWYTLRLEVIGSTIKVYFDGEAVGSITDTDFTTAGQVGLWTANKSFEIDDVTIGDANQKPTSLTLSPATTTYVAETGDAAKVITVSAKTSTGAADTFSVVSSNPSVVSATVNGTSLSLTPLSVGTATITITSGSKPDLKRTISATIAAGFVMPTETYSLSGVITPAANETNTYEDQTLKITFDSAPTLGATGSVRIFKLSDDSVVDTIKVSEEKDSIGYGTLRTINTKPIRISGNTASINLHANKLVAGTAYYVAISESVFANTKLGGKNFVGLGKNAGWTFTTRSTQPATGKTTITVDDDGSTADFRTVQSALNYVMKNVALDTAATIEIKNGVYEEPLYLRVKNNLTITGESKDNTIIQYTNNDGMNPGSTTRALMLVETCDLLTLEKLTIKNTTLIGSGGQAETLYFNSTTGRLIAKNANFISEQDTLLLKGYTWFYKTLVAGNVDFIWGYSKASLFEESEIRTLGDSRGNGSGGYVLQARVEKATDKGFVFLNSSITRGAGPLGHTVADGKTYLARSGGDATLFDNIVFINTKMDSHILDAGWYGSPLPTPNPGNATSGWREYNTMNLNGTPLSLTARQYSFNLALSDISSTFCTRAQIFSGFNSGAGWDPMPTNTNSCQQQPQ